MFDLPSSESYKAWVCLSTIGYGLQEDLFVSLLSMFGLLPIFAFLVILDNKIKEDFSVHRDSESTAIQKVDLLHR